jgi:hypothetical protein
VLRGRCTLLGPAQGSLREECLLKRQNALLEVVQPKHFHPGVVVEARSAQVTVSVIAVTGRTCSGGPTQKVRITECTQVRGRPCPAEASIATHDHRRDHRQHNSKRRSQTPLLYSLQWRVVGGSSLAVQGARRFKGGYVGSWEPGGSSVLLEAAAGSRCGGSLLRFIAAGPLPLLRGRLARH